MLLGSIGANKLYLKGLDGLRALCALFILLGHISQTDFCNWGGRELFSIPVPVCSAYVFFVISGFLAGFRMETVTVLGSYYKKKAWRLFPLYYIYVLLTIVVYLVLGWGKVVVDGRLLYYLLLAPEIPFCTATGILPLAHLWFIGVLILFYALVPLLVKTERGKGKHVSLVLAISWFLLKALSYLVFGKESFIYRFCGTVCFDILFFSVFAGLFFRERNVPDSLWGESIIKPLSILSFFLFLGSGFYGHLIPAPIRTEYVSLLAVLIIAGQQSSHPIISLENKVFRWFGDISYEIYVVQILVIILLSCLYLVAGVELPDVIIYFVCFLVVIGCARLMKKLTSFLRVAYMKK